MTEPRKLDKLTAEQEALMQVVRDEWINLSMNSGKAVQEHEIREGIDWLYSISNLPKHPRIVICNSYIEMKLEYNLLPRLVEDPVWTSLYFVTNSVRNPVKGSVKDSVRNSLNSLTNLYKSVKDSVHDSIWNSVWNSVRRPVDRQVRIDVCESVMLSVENSLSFRLALIDDSIGVAHGAGWLSFYDYFSRIGIMNHENFNIFRDMLRAGIWTSCYYKHRVLVCRLPTKVSKDEQGRLHSTTGPAVQWRDGSGQYFLHGVNFSQSLEEHMSQPELWKKIISKELSFIEILRISNIEQRHVALKLYGAEKLLQEAGAQRIDKSERGNELYKIENLIGGRTLKLLKYKDPSTERIYVSFVPYEYEKADEAMAWKFQLSESEYKLLNVEA
jgi:hypothetical protein